MQFHQNSQPIDPMRNSGAELDLYTCPELGKGDKALYPGSTGYRMRSMH